MATGGQVGYASVSKMTKDPYIYPAESHPCCLSILRLIVLSAYRHPVPCEVTRGMRDIHAGLAGREHDIQDIPALLSVRQGNPVTLGHNTCQRAAE